MDTIFQDLRHAAPKLLRSPGFTLAAVLTLAVGIGATTAMFSVVDGVLVQPLPVKDQDRVLVVWKEHLARDFTHVPFSYPAFQDVRDRSRTLEGLAALPYWGTSRWILRRESGPIELQGVTVTGDFFRTLGVRPALGRVLAREDDVEGAPLVVVISHGLWQRVFGGDPKVVGQTLRIGEGSSTVVGVAPRGFDYPQGAEVWAPFVPFWTATASGRQMLETRRSVSLDLVGRLRRGATREQARAELTAVLRDLDTGRRSAHEDQAVVVQSLPEVIVGDVRPAILILSAAVALVLLIAGVNVTNLLLVQGIARQRELAIRAAIGAGRGRIARQLLAENLLLGLAGGILGVLIASWMVDSLVALAPAEIPRLDEVGVHGRTLVFAAGTSVLTAFLFGLVPALGVARSPLSTALRSGVRITGERGASRRARHALVTGQIALALLVLVGAALLVRSLARLQALDMGFAAENRVLAEVAYEGPEYDEHAKRLALFGEIVPRVEALPGVVAATPVLSKPFSGNGGFDIPFIAEGQAEPEAAANPMLNYESVSPNYFRTLGLPIVRGRATMDQDRAGSLPVVVVNESLARRIWPGEDPIGRRIKFGVSDSPGPWRTVVGVAADARYRALEEIRPSVYVPWEQGVPAGPYNLVVRTASDAAALLPVLRRTVEEIDPAMLVLSATPLAQLLAEPLARPRFNTALLGIFAALGLGLSAVGIYGTMAASLRQRTREMAIRIAVGATAGEVRRLLLGQGLRIALVGALFGVAASLVATRLLASMLFEVSPTDATVLGFASLFVLLVALAAAYMPARRATRVDPIRVLNTE